MHLTFDLLTCISVSIVRSKSYYHYIKFWPNYRTT